MPVLCDRVSADASRVSAARSHRDGSRPFALAELVDLVGQRVVDVAGPLREHVEQLVGDAGDLGLAVDDRSPVDAEAVGELGAQHRLVEAAEHPLVPLQVAGVERQPATVGGLDLGRDHGVGVDLRVIGPRRRLAERRHRQPVRVGMQAARRSTRIRVVDPNRSRCASAARHGDVVGLEEPAVAGQRPPHRQRLRRRERRVEPRHRPHHPPARRRTGRRARGPSGVPGRRVTARQQRLELLDRRRRPDRPSPAAWRPDHTPGTSPGAAVRYWA